MNFIKKIVIILAVRPIEIIIAFFYFARNFIVIIYNRVDYKCFPKINGKLIVKNHGKCFFGMGVHFNSTILSNLAGLYKPCTIYVLKGAILNIGDSTGFSGVSIYCTNNITIGNYCNIGVNVAIWDTDFHPLNYLERRVTIVGAKKAPIVIGNDVFIGANSIILKGITIGDRAIIGAGSIVTKNIPSDEIWAGNPAKFIKFIN